MILERNIKLSNLLDVDEIDKAKLDSVLANTYDKLARIVNNTILLRANFKSSTKGGARKHYEIHLHLSIPGIEVVSSSTDWNLLTALEEAALKLEKESIKKMKP